ncbi:hypothetical protein HK101_010743 [Irineochytrium annulatum]|nr:hypothetical protein HK101_010743 [Irineochytrium annulatum]
MRPSPLRRCMSMEDVAAGTGRTTTAGALWKSASAPELGLHRHFDNDDGDMVTPSTEEEDEDDDDRALALTLISWAASAVGSHAHHGLFLSSPPETLAACRLMMMHPAFKSKRKRAMELRILVIQRQREQHEQQEATEESEDESTLIDSDGEEDGENDVVTIHPMTLRIDGKNRRLFPHKKRSDQGDAVKVSSRIPRPKSWADMRSSAAVAQGLKAARSVSLKVGRPRQEAPEEEVTAETGQKVPSITMVDFLNGETKEGDTAAPASSSLDSKTTMIHKSGSSSDVRSSAAPDPVAAQNGRVARSVSLKLKRPGPRKMEGRKDDDEDQAAAGVSLVDFLNGEKDGDAVSPTALTITATTSTIPSAVQGWRNGVTRRVSLKSRSRETGVHENAVAAPVEDVVRGGDREVPLIEFLSGNKDEDRADSAVKGDVDAETLSALPPLSLDGKHERAVCPKSANEPSVPDGRIRGQRSWNDVRLSVRTAAANVPSVKSVRHLSIEAMQKGWAEATCDNIAVKDSTDSVVTPVDFLNGKDDIETAVTPTMSPTKADKPTRLPISKPRSKIKPSDDPNTATDARIHRPRSWGDVYSSAASAPDVKVKAVRRLSLKSKLPDTSLHPDPLRAEDGEMLATDVEADGGLRGRRRNASSWRPRRSKSARRSFEPPIATAATSTRGVSIDQRSRSASRGASVDGRGDRRSWTASRTSLDFVAGALGWRRGSLGESGTASVDDQAASSVPADVNAAVAGDRPWRTWRLPARVVGRGDGGVEVKGRKAGDGEGLVMLRGDGDGGVVKAGGWRKGRLGGDVGKIGVWIRRGNVSGEAKLPVIAA